MMSTMLQALDHPIALCCTHLLAPAPDLLNQTTTTLSITRDTTLFGRDFTVHLLRPGEPMRSSRRVSLLFTVRNKFWSTSRHQEIRDASGRPLLELRRQWWQRAWKVKRADGGDDLLSAEMCTAIDSTQIAVRVTNALLSARQLDEYHQQLLGQHIRSHASQRALSSQMSNYSLPPREPSPPPYSDVVAADHSSERHARSSSCNPYRSHSSDNSSIYPDDDTNSNTMLPSYDSLWRFSSNHSLQNLLAAVESPREPAPALSYTFQPARRYSDTMVDEKIDLKVLQQSNAVTVVVMGDRKIVRIRREKLMTYGLYGTMPRWEVEIAEGLDLLIVSFLLPPSPFPFPYSLLFSLTPPPLPYSSQTPTPNI